jgi:hypothetical protein
MGGKTGSAHGRPLVPETTQSEFHSETRNNVRFTHSIEIQVPIPDNAFAKGIAAQVASALDRDSDVLIALLMRTLPRSLQRDLHITADIKHAFDDALTIQLRVTLDGRPVGDHTAIWSIVEKAALDLFTEKLKRVQSQVQGEPSKPIEEVVHEIVSAQLRER